MTDKTKLVAISRTDDIDALDASSSCGFASPIWPRDQLRVTVSGLHGARARSDPFPVTAVDVERYINELNGSVKMATISFYCMPFKR